MNETEPKYFAEFRKEFLGVKNELGSFRVHVDKKFEETNKNIEDSIDVLTISIEHQFEEQEKGLQEYMHENFVSKLDLYETEVRVNDKFERLDEILGKIEGHIGRYEIRGQDLEQILLQDHKPRIIELEKIVFAA